MMCAQYKWYIISVCTIRKPIYYLVRRTKQNLPAWAKQAIKRRQILCHFGKMCLLIIIISLRIWVLYFGIVSAWWWRRSAGFNFMWKTTDESCACIRTHVCATGLKSMLRFVAVFKSESQCLWNGKLHKQDLARLSSKDAKPIKQY